MTSVLLSGLSSVSDRTLFTRHAPIVKQPLALLTGSDLVVKSPTSVEIVSIDLTSSDIGKTLTISGSLSGRNDGTFVISAVPNSITAELEGVNFYTVDDAATTAKISILANAIKAAFNKHRVHRDPRLDSPFMTHQNDDKSNVVASADAFNLSTALTLLNEIRTKFSNHISNTGGDFHVNRDVWNPVVAVAASSLASAVTLANELRTRYDAHRLERRSHALGDADSVVFALAVDMTMQSVPGSLAGPFVWTLNDPRLGTVADSPDDVAVRINGVPVDVQAVFGMFGAVVLPSKPAPTDTVAIDYDYLNNPPARFLRLNSPEFVLNQDKNNGIMGLPTHRYRARSYLIDPGNTPDLISAVSPLRKSWKYKAFEREYSATTNDPEKLLLNSPFKSIKYPVLRTVVKETTISYDATVLPENAADPWSLQGEGQFLLAGGLLTIIDNDLQSSVNSKPPFYTHTSDIVSDSVVSAAFRVQVGNFLPDGVFTGVGFGISDGYNVILTGFVFAEAVNLSTAIATANSVKAKFNLHVVEPTVHGVDDQADAIEIVDARDLTSLVILLNALKLKHGLHIDKADPTLATIRAHKTVDTTNEIVSADAEDLATSVVLVNELCTKFNAHRVSSGVHFTDDSKNEVLLTRQAGILTNAGDHEDIGSWETSAVDWTNLKTYRVHRDIDGNAQLFLSGDTEPMVSVLKDRLPVISDFEGKFDPVQQVFFGSISREATSTSAWNLIRANISPVDSNLLEDNKSVAYDGSVIPELDSTSPWITLGHGGAERIYPGAPGGLLSDSSASAQPSEILLMGASSGAFRGYMRFEPILMPSTTCTVDFSTSVDYYTFSLGNRADGLFIDDGQLSVHFAFLHFSPSPAMITGTSLPSTVNSSDQFVLSFDGGASITISFTSIPPTPTASQVSAIINAVVGFDVAGDDGTGRVRLTHGSGAASYVTIVGGSAASKMGFSIGKYFGSDSNPESRVSWFGDSLPDQEPVPWSRSGGQTTLMIGAAHSPVMRSSDVATNDYVAFTMSNPVVVFGTMEASVDWKLDFRVSFNSHSAGEAVPAATPLVDLYFCGALVNIDEGIGGKNVELHCSVDASGNPHLNLVTFNAGTNTIDPVAQYAFVWNDGESHSINIFKNRDAGQFFIYADGGLLTPTAGVPALSSFGSSVGSTPSVTFGSGSEPVSNVDLRTAVSNVDWESVAVFSDSKISDPLAANNRYIGIHRGGDPTLLNSWYVARVDWTSFHTYRLVRDPTSFVAVYLDGADVPVLSISYDPIRLPPCSSSFLNRIATGRSVIAWGAFDPVEISRTRWRYLNYSMGKLTLTDRIVPPHQVLNQANVMASPEHTRTAVSHGHFGFTTYSGGTPDDDFMASSDVPAYTILGERIPPIPKTQDLESRGGLVRSASPAIDVSAVDFMNYRGFLGRFDDDTTNVVTANSALNLTQTLAAVVIVANGVAAAYEYHRVRTATAANVHAVNDTTNVITSPIATDLPTSIARLTDFKSVFNSHVADGTYHSPDDPGDVLTSADPTDLDSCVILCNEIVSKYGNHLVQGFYHLVPASPPYFDPFPVAEPPASDLFTCQLLLDNIRWCFIRHSSNTYGSLRYPIILHSRAINYEFSLNYPISYVAELANHLKALYNQHIGVAGLHPYRDTFNPVTQMDASEVNSAILLANAIRTSYNLHVTGQQVHFTTGFDAFAFGSVAVPLQAAIALANDILANFNLHVVAKESHAEQDVANVVTISEPTDETSVIELANALKKAFNLHRTSVSRGSNVHVRNDIVNVVIASDATDLDMAIDLLNAIMAAYGNHRVQDGVHGSSAFIRLEPPSRVVYEGMRFWTTEEGTENLVSPFSDDETWHVESVQYQANKALLYDGTVLPEQATIVSVGARPANVAENDTLILEIDRLPPVTVIFQVSDTSLANVVNRINLAIPGCAQTQGTELRLSSPAPGISSSVIVNGGTAKGKLGLEIPHHSSWFVVSENPLDVSIALMSVGGEDFLRYGVSGPSPTMYANMAGYSLAPSIGFDMSVRIRMNSVGILGGEDSGIYVGLSGVANTPGFTAAIGWGGFGTGRYVKLQDMNSGTIFDRVPFDWFDGAFHTYNLTYDETSQTLRLSIDASRHPSPPPEPRSHGND